MQYSSLDTIVREICAIKGDPAATDYIRVARVVRRVVQQLNIHLMPNVESKFYTIGDNLTISLSGDQEDVTKVGIVINKCLVNLNYASELIHPDLTAVQEDTTSSCTCNNIADLTNNQTEAVEPIATNHCSRCTFHNYYYHSNGSYGEYYGYKSDRKDLGSSKYDVANNDIIFNSGAYIKAGSKVLVETKPVMSNSKLDLIPDIYFMTIFQRTMQIINQGDGQIYAASMAKNEFIAENDMVKRHYETYTLDDIINAFRSEYTPTPKN